MKQLIVKIKFNWVINFVLVCLFIVRCNGKNFEITKDILGINGHSDLSVTKQEKATFGKINGTFAKVDGKEVFSIEANGIKFDIPDSSTKKKETKDTKNTKGSICTVSFKSESYNKTFTGTFVDNQCSIALTNIPLNTEVNVTLIVNDQIYKAVKIFQKNSEGNDLNDKNIFLVNEYELSINSSRLSIQDKKAEKYGNKVKITLNINNPLALSGIKYTITASDTSFGQFSPASGILPSNDQLVFFYNYKKDGKNEFKLKLMKAGYAVQGFINGINYAQDGVDIATNKSPVVSIVSKRINGKETLTAVVQEKEAEKPYKYEWNTDSKNIIFEGNVKSVNGKKTIIVQNSNPFGSVSLKVTNKNGSFTRVNYVYSKIGFNWEDLSLAWKKAIATNVKSITGRESQLKLNQKLDILNLTNFTYNCLSCSDIYKVKTLFPIKYLINLTKLHLGDNQVTSIDNGVFSDISGLAHLSLVGNQITSIGIGAFANLTSLNELYLGGNQITSIETGTFTGLTSLAILNLNINKITSIGIRTFANLTNLNELYLGGNQITSIETGTFTGLTGLTKLHLGDNRIISIESGDFLGLNRLTDLHLTDNQITSIGSNTFTGLINLLNLYLGDNQIISIEDRDFTGLTNLAILNLNGNRITSIENGSFADIINLTKLYLGNNQITSIDNSTFTGLTRLNELYLYHNQITNIANNAFTHIDSLYRLYLYSQISSGSVYTWTATQRTAIQAQIKAVPEGASSSSSFIYFDKNTGSVAGTR